MMTTTFDRDLDVRGLNCPLPILRAKKALAELTLEAKDQGVRRAAFDQLLKQDEISPANVTGARGLG